VLRSFCAGLSATAVLVASSVACIAWLTRPDLPPDPSAARAASGAVAPPPPAPAAQRAPAGSPRHAAAAPATPRAPTLAGAFAPPRRDPVAPTARRSMPRQRRRELSSFRRELIAGFAALERAVALCAPADASFVLEVETVTGGARIIGAAIDSRGAASDAALACARSRLLGHTISAPSAEPARHLHMRFSVKSAT
jgi:hypothetical protein